MCVICLKPKDLALPSEAIMKDCFDNNRDGAGFAYSADDGVHWEKGFSTFELFLAALEDCDRRVGLQQRSLLLHFRIGTHGSKNSPEHTHPFPLSDDYAEMEKLTGIAPMVVGHNGILRLGSLVGADRYTAAKKDKAEDEGHLPSDSMEFIKHVLWPLSLIPDAFHRKDVLQLIPAISEGNRLAMLFADGTILHSGKWDAYEGLQYSNLNFIPYVAPVTPAKTNFYNNYDGYYHSGYWPKKDSSTKKFDESTVNQEDSKVESNKTEVAEYLDDYRKAVNEREARISAKWKDSTNGFAAMKKHKHCTFYVPAKISYTTFVEQRQRTFRTHLISPEELYYVNKDSRVLYVYDETTDILHYVGEVLSIDYNIPLDQMPYSDDDFRWWVESTGQTYGSQYLNLLKRLGIILPTSTEEKAGSTKVKI